MKKSLRNIAFYLLLIMIIIAIIQMTAKGMDAPKELNVYDLKAKIESNEVKSIKIMGREVNGTLLDGSKFHSYFPDVEKGYLDELQIENSNVELNAEKKPEPSIFLSMIPTIVIILILIVFWYVFMQQAQGGGGGKVMNFGKSRAKIKKPNEGEKIKFSDVAGLEEEKIELAEVVDFLKNPKKYIEVGARIPKGILMVGPPGTGKTYLTKAVSGEAEVPFYSISGSDFVEMFVGVGASRVRDLFEQAKKNSPCIVFIDEIDAVGRRRGAGLGGGHDEREQTLNQLLVEMDGFGINEGVIVIAATNRPDILDPALLRPGRFDRQVHVGVPDVKGREAILKIHSRKKPLESDLDLKILAKRTIGFTPADLENLLNEAAILTARENLSKIPMRLAEEAITKVLIGPEKRSHVVSEKDKKITAYHESGHAVISKMLKNVDPVHLVTIIPRGMAAGFTMNLPKEEKSHMSKARILEQLIMLLGGRVAEEIKFGAENICTGASNDIERATDIVRALITQFGMDGEMGTMAYGEKDKEVFIGRNIGHTKNYSEETAAKIDQRMRFFIDDAYEKARKILKDNWDKVEAVTAALIEFETIDAEQFEMLMDGKSVEEVGAEIAKKNEAIKDNKKSKDKLNLDKSKSNENENSNDESSKDVEFDISLDKQSDENIKDALIEELDDIEIEDDKKNS